MIAEQITALIDEQIGDAWDETNLHGVDLRAARVVPKRIKVLDRQVQKGEITDEVMEVWLVLEERPETQEGYKIVFDEKSEMFGLASKGFGVDAQLCLAGLYGEFWIAFRAM